MRCCSRGFIPCRSVKAWVIVYFFGLIQLHPTLLLAEVPATKSAQAINSLLLDAAQQPGLMVTVGERGHILYSTDKGHNWEQADVPTRVLLTGVHLHDNMLGWAVGHDATILRTRDGAKSWQLVYSNKEEETPLLDVWFKDNQHGFAIGAYGLFMFTQDGGQTWQQKWISEEDDFHLNHIVSMKDGTLFIAAEAGVIYRSRDEGETWQSLPSPYHGSFFGSLPADDEASLFLFGLRGHLFISHDKGNQWENINTNTTAMLTAGIKRKNNCYISGLSGVLLILAQCDSSKINYQQLPGRNSISAMLNGDDALILVGESGIIRFIP